MNIPFTNKLHIEEFLFCILRTNVGRATNTDNVNKQRNFIVCSPDPSSAARLTCTIFLNLRPNKTRLLSGLEMQTK